MKIRILILSVILTLLADVCSVKAQKEEKKVKCDYAILVGKDVREDLSWSKLIETLQAERGGEVFGYNENPGETFDKLKQVRPHYVVVLDKVENVTSRFVRTLHMMSRNMDEDPYEDFVWGIITGDTPSAAMRFVTEAQVPRKENEAWLKQCDLEKMCGFSGKCWWGEKYKNEWKRWMDTPGKPTVAEAVFLQQQYNIERLLEWNPNVLTLTLPDDCDGNTDNEVIRALVKKELNINGTDKQIELLKNRDVIVYYGDPRWNLRLRKSEDNGFNVGFKKNNEKCVITLKAGKERIGVSEFIYFFPKRLEVPKLLNDLQKGEEIIFDETFMLVRNIRLEEEEKYVISFSVEGGASLAKKLLKQIRPPQNIKF